MGCAGNKEIRSPNLDRVAREGIRFDNFFCASPVCSPARASILTGRIPSQHGVHDFVSMPHDREGKPNLDIPANSIYFLAGMPSYADLLAEVGYDTCLSGKWHLGDGLQPRCGFQKWYPMPYGQSSYRDVPMVESGEVRLHEDIYATDLFTDNALKFLENQVDEDRPFCLTLASPTRRRTGRGEESITRRRPGMIITTTVSSNRRPAWTSRCRRAFNDTRLKGRRRALRPPSIPKSESNT